MISLKIARNHENKVTFCEFNIIWKCKLKNEKKESKIEMVYI